MIKFVEMNDGVRAHLMMKFVMFGVIGETMPQQRASLCV